MLITIITFLRPENNLGLPDMINSNQYNTLNKILGDRYHFLLS